MLYGNLADPKELGVTKGDIVKVTLKKDSQKLNFIINFMK